MAAKRWTPSVSPAQTPSTMASARAPTRIVRSTKGRWFHTTRPRVHRYKSTGLADTGREAKPRPRLSLLHATSGPASPRAGLPAHASPVNSAAAPIRASPRRAGPQIWPALAPSESLEPAAARKRGDAGVARRRDGLDQHEQAVHPPHGRRARAQP